VPSHEVETEVSVAKKKSDEAAAIERLAVQQEMTNRLLSLWMTTVYPPLFPAATVAAALSETAATPAEIARIVPGVTSRSVASIKWAKGRGKRQGELPVDQGAGQVDAGLPV
jgi:hypothetical protein